MNMHPSSRALCGLAVAALLTSVACSDAPSSEGAVTKEDASAGDSATPGAEAGPSGAVDSAAPAEAGSAEAGSAEAGDAGPAKAGSSELDQLLAWLAPNPLAVSYDRLEERLDAAAVNVVFGIPPKSGDLLEEREMLDEALDIVFDDDAEASNWLGNSSLAFTVALSKTPYFVRPLTKAKALLGPLFESGGFAKTEVEGIEVWLPGGSFPWRIALLEGDIGAFIPVDVPGAGLEPLNSAQAAPPSAIETEIQRAISEDPQLRMILVSAGPLVHYDVTQSIAQVQFGLRKVDLGGQHGYDGQVRLAPTDSVDVCADELRKREHPEENTQIQAMMKEVAFVVDQGTVVGQLGVKPEQIKHLLLR